MFDRRLLQCFDWGLLLLTLSIGAAGLVVLYSAVSAGVTEPNIALFKRQLVWYGGGLLIMIGCFLFDYKQFERFANAIYLASVGSLMAVLFFGKYVSGSRRWLPLGPFSLQPSEMAKVAVIIVLARYYAKLINTEGLNFKDLMMPAFLTAIPFVLIVRQPDLGTAMVLALIAGVMTLFAKIERRDPGLAGGNLHFIDTPGLVFFAWLPKAADSNLSQSRSRSLGRRLPYHPIQDCHRFGNDYRQRLFKRNSKCLVLFTRATYGFHFSVLAEEWGLVGSMTLIILFLIIIAWGLSIAGRCRDPFGTILSVGVTAMIAWQVFINIGMVMGLLPVVGVTLPFVSYGGSSIITMMIGVGMLMNVSMRRFKFE